MVAETLSSQSCKRRLARLLPGRVRASREAAGLSQPQLATFVGMSTSHVQHVESGKSWPTVWVLTTLAFVLGASLDAWLDLRDDG